MTSKTANKFSPEVRARPAIRLHTGINGGRKSKTLPTPCVTRSRSSNEWGEPPSFVKKQACERRTADPPLSTDDTTSGIDRLGLNATKPLSLALSLFFFEEPFVSQH
jgi:hypothetical protein